MVFVFYSLTLKDLEREKRWNKERKKRPSTEIRTRQRCCNISRNVRASGYRVYIYSVREKQDDTPCLVRGCTPKNQGASFYDRSAKTLSLPLRLHERSSLISWKKKKRLSFSGISNQD